MFKELQVARSIRKNLFPVFYAVNSISWTYLITNFRYALFHFEKGSVEEAIFMTSMVLFLILCGAISLSRFYDFFKLNMIWVVSGLFLPCLHYVRLNLVSVILGGFIAGFALPSCLAWFLDKTTFKNRGCLSSIAIVCSLFFVFPLRFMAAPTSLSFLLATVLAAWRLLGLLSLFYMSKFKQRFSMEFGEDFSPTLNRVRFFSLFLGVFALFMIIDPAEQIVIVEHFGYSTLLQIFLVEISVALPVMVVIGHLSDLWGRRPILLVSYLLLGFGYAALSVVPSKEAVLLYAAMDGCAWGALTVLFGLVVWGDIASPKVRPILLAIASSITYASNVVAIEASVFLKELEVYQAFSLAMLFLFSAALFLLFAPETVPASVLEERRAEQYVSKALKIKEKYERKRRR